MIMKSTVILLAALAAAAVAGAAAASDHLSDMDYLKANRCRGIAEGLGVGGTASLDTLIKSEGRSRVDTIYTRGQQELARGKRDADKTDLKERLSAELNGSCMAYLGGASATASAARNASTSH
jgi:hypothetical protein